MAKKALSAKEREAYQAGGFRFDPPSRHRSKIALGELEAAVQSLRARTRLPREILAALAIPSRQALARWRAGDDAIPYSVREHFALVHALRQRLAESGDFASLKLLRDLELRGRPSIPGQAINSVNSSLCFFNLFSLKKQLSGGRDQRGKRDETTGKEATR